MQMSKDKHAETDVSQVYCRATSFELKYDNSYESSETAKNWNSKRAKPGGQHTITNEEHNN